MASEVRPAGSGSIFAFGGANWSNLSNITASDDGYCFAQLSTTTTFSSLLYAKDFGFGIPFGAAINGITVTIERKQGGIGSPVDIKDRQVQLVKSGALYGNDKASADSWPTVDTEKDYGSSSDLWGVTWLPSYINDDDFGVAISVRTPSTSGDTCDASIDYIEIEVTYGEVVSIVPWTDFGAVIRRQRRRALAPFGDTPAGA